MKICFISPPDRSKIDEDIEYCFTVYNVPHLGIGYIVSYLRSHGIHSDYYECPGMRISLNGLQEIIEKERYDIVGISSYDYNSFNIVKLAKFIKQVTPSTFLMLGGYYATLNCKQLMKQVPEIDCCVLGEGEVTTYELIKRLIDGVSYRDVLGIAYRDEDNAIIENAFRPMISNLDDLPFPDRNFIAKRGMSTMITSRGCYGRCTFCSIRSFYKNQKGPAIRLRSAQNVIEEIEMLIKERNVNFINIFDDNFLVQSKENIARIKELCILAKKRGLAFKFSITVRANDVVRSRELLIQLKEIGLQYLFIGIESFLERQLDLYQKGTTPQENIEALNLAYELGIKTDIGFLAFDPYVTLDEIVRNVRTLMNTSYFSNFYEGGYLLSMYSALSPVYGSDMRESLERDGLITKDNPYCFVHQNVKRCYELMKIWADKIYRVNLKYYMILKAKDTGAHDLAARLYDAKKGFSILDAQFLLQLCEDVKNDSVCLDDFEAYLEPWLAKLETFKVCFEQAKKGVVH